MSTIGPTGESPIANDPHDRGGLRAQVETEKAGTIKVTFGASINFLRMTADEALAFSQALRERALKLKKATDN